MEQVEQERAYLQQKGLLSETGGSLQKIEVISEKAAYNGAVAFIEYTIDYGDRVEILSFNDLTNVGAAFTVRDEHSNIENYVAMYDDSIILDGREVTYTFSETETVESVGRAISPRVSDRWYQVACPYDIASAYTTFVRTTRDDNIDLSNSLKDVTYSVALAVISSLAKASLLTNVFTSALYAILQKAAPTSKGLSYVDYQYWHKSCGSLSGGHISAYGAYVTKHIIDWYPKINRAGTPQTSVEFEIQKIY